MIDLSNLKAPGWQRIVAELSAPAPDDRTFLMRLLASLTQVSGARQGVLFVIDHAPADVSEGGASGGASVTPEPRPLTAWPPPAGGSMASGAVEVESDRQARSAALGTSEGTQIRVYGLEDQSGYYDSGGSKGFVVGVPITLSPPGSSAESVAPKLVITLLIESRSKQAMQTTLALIEVLAGYVNAHIVRQQHRRSKAAAAALDLSSRLLAAVNYAQSFKGAALQLCNDLVRHLKADRVALGWVHGVGESGAVRVQSLSDTEHIDRRLAMIQKLEAAMDECLDQEQPVVHPPPPAEGEGGDSVLSQAITHAHRALTASDARLKVMSLPMRCEIEGESRVLGVVTIETTDDAVIDPGGVEVLQATMDLLAPAMRLRRSDDRALPKRAWASMLRAGQWAVGPKHTAWKLAGVIGLVGLILASTVPVTYRVEAPVTIEARGPRTIAVPFDGLIQSLAPGVTAGTRVKAGDLLLEMNTTELELSALQARAELMQATQKADSLRAQPGKLSEAMQTEEEAAQARARLKLAEYRIQQAKIVAPIDGTIIIGRLEDKVGASVRQGEALYMIAPLDNMMAVAKIHDSDIGFVSEGGAGQLATKAEPGKSIPFTIDRVVPLAQAKDGRNAFDVRVNLDATSSSVRPGMEGIAKFDAGRHSLVWIASRRVLNALRLWLWW